MHRIRDSRGDWVEGKENLFAAILDHFEEVYRSDGVDVDEGYFQDIPCMVTDHMNSSLLAPVTDEEIKVAAFSLGALKAPGPDGYNGLF